MAGSLLAAAAVVNSRRFSQTQLRKLRKLQALRAWQRVDEGPGAAEPCDIVCLVDPKVLASDSRDWEEFQSFAKELFEGTVSFPSALVRLDDSPTLLLRPVSPGEQQWPIMQEGRT
ncbi:unnamed protein product [Cladocopium goreaui]|uniref:Uncharacterized protein n=1 Tax=Cladocopium goreaui TaxID=2562237 RepID=A0A9P1GCE6_9DINO|nr:unnamed protein product [Cladocopium goreaui]